MSSNSHSCEPDGPLCRGSRHVLGMTAVRDNQIPMGHFRIDGHRARPGANAAPLMYKVF